MLVSCPECGHKVSDKARICPQCGFPDLPVSGPVLDELPRLLPPTPPAPGLQEMLESEVAGRDRARRKHQEDQQRRADAEALRRGEEQRLHARTLRLLEVLRQRGYPNSLRLKIRGEWAARTRGWVIDEEEFTNSYMGGRTVTYTVLLSDGTVEKVSEWELRSGAISHPRGQLALLRDRDIVRVLLEAGISDVPTDLR